MGRRHRAIVEIATALHVEGFDAYMVGGVVRALLQDDKNAQKMEVNMATNATPKQVEALFSPSYHVVPTDMGHGTVTVMASDMSRESAHVHLSTYQHGGKTIYSDLSHRDFTINAIAYDPLTKEMRDPLGGIEDLIVRKIVRAVGDATQCIAKDPLRAVRAARLAAQLHLGIERATLQAMAGAQVALTVGTKVPAESIRDELMGGLATDRADEFISILASTNLLFSILPELYATQGQIQEPKRHRFDVYNHSLRTMAELGRTADPVLRLVALLHDAGKPATYNHNPKNPRFDGHAEVGAVMIANAMCRLHMSPDQIRRATRLVKNHSITYGKDTTHSWTDIDVHNWLATVGYRDWKDQLRLAFADAKSAGVRPKSAGIDYIRELWDRAYQITEGDNDTDLRLPTAADLAITADDIMSLGLSGDQIDSMQKSLLLAIIDDPTVNTPEFLTRLVLLAKETVYAAGSKAVIKATATPYYPDSS